MTALPHVTAGSIVICADGGSNRLYDMMAPVRNR